MKIKLFIGEGWTPFGLEPDEAVAWVLPNADDLDVLASIDNLARLFVDRVNEIYPDAEIEELPQAAGGGKLVSVELDESAVDDADEALALTAEDLAEGGYLPAELIEGEIVGLLDGIILERPHNWQVEK